MWREFEEVRGVSVPFHEMKAVDRLIARGCASGESEGDISPLIAWVDVNFDPSDYRTAWGSRQARDHPGLPDVAMSLGIS